MRNFTYISELCTRMAIIDQGEILLEAEPLGAVEALRRRIWRRAMESRKVVVDEAGVETELPMDDWVEVGVYSDGEPYIQKHRISSGKQTITVTMPRPAYAEGSGAVSPKLREGGKTHQRRHRPTSPAERLADRRQHRHCKD